MPHIYLVINYILKGQNNVKYYYYNYRRRRHHHHHHHHHSSSHYHPVLAIVNVVKEGI
jgi:hypothetical protein